MRCSYPHPAYTCIENSDIYINEYITNIKKINETDFNLNTYQNKYQSRQSNENSLIDTSGNAFLFDEYEENQRSW